jgi:hypothetical protein
MGLFGGMIAITDMRLLGWAMKGSSITDVVQQLRLWKQIGFVMVVGCGSWLLAAKAELYYYDPFYWTKITLLLLAASMRWCFIAVSTEIPWRWIVRQRFRPELKSRRVSHSFYGSAL